MPIYRCIVYQVEVENALYVLSGGQWFRVDLAYKEQVYADVEALSRLEGLPDADAGSNDDAYNVKAAVALASLCLDKKLVYDGCILGSSDTLRTLPSSSEHQTSLSCVWLAVRS